MSVLCVCVYVHARVCVVACAGGGGGWHATIARHTDPNNTAAHHHVVRVRGHRLGHSTHTHTLTHSPPPLPSATRHLHSRWRTYLHVRDAWTHTPHARCSPLRWRLAWAMRVPYPCTMEVGPSMPRTRGMPSASPSTSNDVSMYILRSSGSAFSTWSRS